MRDLRVYIGAPDDKASDWPAAFYSRRAGGPIYRWLFEEESGRWRYARIDLTGQNVRLLSIAQWNTVPATLQAELWEHYLE